MRRAETMNPFHRRENYEKKILMLYRAITIVTWLLVVLLSLIYSIDDSLGVRTIQEQNHLHPSPFAVSPVLVAVYWTILLLSQLAYIYKLFCNDAELVVAAANFGSHFVLNNAFVSIFILLWVHGIFWPAEIVLVLNLINLVTQYFRSIEMPPFDQWAVVSGPQVWSLVLLFTNGAAMVDARHLPSRIVANVFIWTFYLYGSFFIAAYQDQALGASITYLTLALAVEQLSIQALSLQTCFAFIIVVILAISMVLIAMSRMFGKELPSLRNVGDSDERRHLLDDEY